MTITVGCGKRKHNLTSDISEKSLAELVGRLDELSHSEWDFLSAKTNVKITSGDQSNNFKASLRMKRDSALLVNISFAGIPIVQSILTKDSVKVVNRKDKCYKFQDLSFVDSLIDFPIEYQQLQDLLIAKPILFNKDAEHIQISNNTLYEIKTKRSKNNSSKDTINISYFLAPTTMELQSTTIESKADQAKIDVFYSGKHEKIEGIVLPQEVRIVLSRMNKISIIEISYNKPDITTEKKITLTAPENYVVCP